MRSLLNNHLHLGFSCISTNNNNRIFVRHNHGPRMGSLFKVIKPIPLTPLQQKNLLIATVPPVQPNNRNFATMHRRL